MAELLKGKPVADAILARCANQAEKLKEEHIIPVLAILRVGENGLIKSKQAIKGANLLVVHVLWGFEYIPIK